MPYAQTAKKSSTKVDSTGAYYNLWSHLCIFFSILIVLASNLIVIAGQPEDFFIVAQSN